MVTIIRSLCSGVRAGEDIDRRHLEADICDTPALANVDRAKLAGLDPSPDRGLGHFQPRGQLLHSLIQVLWHPATRRFVCRRRIVKVHVAD